MAVLFRRILRRLRQKVLSIATSHSQIYVVGYLLSPLRRLNTDAHSGVLNIACGPWFLKWEVEEGALNREREGREAVPANLRDLMCPFAMRQVCGVRLGVLPNLSSAPSESWSWEKAAALQSKLRSFGKTYIKPAAENPELVSGLNSLSVYAPEEITSALGAWLENVMCRPHSYGPTHGDFHAGNILVAGDGQPQLIDFDCYSNDGLQEFDTIYFCFEAAAHGRAQAMGWLDELAADLNGQSEVAKLLPRLGGLQTLNFDEARAVYFVIRLGQEARFYGAFPPLTASRVRELAGRVLGLKAGNS